VPLELLTIKLSSNLKAEFLREIRTGDDFQTATKFVESAISAYILQKRRGEKLAIPLEFVSDKSSDKRQD